MYFGYFLSTCHTKSSNSPNWAVHERTMVLTAASYLKIYYCNKMFTNSSVKFELSYSCTFKLYLTACYQDGCQVNRLSLKRLCSCSVSIHVFSNTSKTEFGYSVTHRDERRCVFRHLSFWGWFDNVLRTDVTRAMEAIYNIWWVIYFLQW